MSDERRPDPDALLAHLRGEEDAGHGRGRLKIFFGATAGVGKTYAMLEAARALAAEGRDVVAGVVETHGRRETGALLAGLEVLPRREIEHGGVRLREFDLAGALERKPALILVDELAHTNAPGSLHEKRWQDVEDLLAAGIDVFTTVNVQHVESVNDVVARITHVRVRETVPDSVIGGAEEVELIDLPPADLLKRLDEGKVYVPEQAQRAKANFFSRGNLIALRQLALRYTAEHVDAAMGVYRRAHAVEATWPIAERLLVGVGPAPSSRRLVRAAKRMADSLGAEWIAVFVETPEAASFPGEDRRRVWETLRLARELGAETTSIPGAGTDALIAFARKHNVSKILVGKPSHPRWRDRLRGSRIDDVIRASGDIDVYVISGDADEEPVRRAPPPEPASRASSYLVVAGLIASLTIVGVLMRERLAPASLLMFYLAAVVVSAARFGRGPSIMASVLSVAGFDWFFVPPYGTFAVTDSEYVVVFAIMLAVALFVTTLTSRLRAQAELAARTSERTWALLEITKELLALEEPVDVERVLVRHVGATLDAEVRQLGLDPFGVPRARTGGPGSEALEPGVARWTQEHGRAAGTGTATLPRARALYLPVRAGTGPVFGVLEVPGDAATLYDPERMQLAETFAAQAAAALERIRLADDERRARQAIDMGRLRSRFVAAAAAELDAPLREIESALGAAPGGAAPSPATLEHAGALLGRLRRLVDDLLDLSGLEGGRRSLELRAVDPAALVDEAIAATHSMLTHDGPAVTREVSDALRPVQVDAAQIVRALGNLIDNAIRHAGPKGHVVVGVDELGDVTQFSVSDDGPGLTVAEQQRLFEPFDGDRGDGEVRPGLGLPVARAIVHAHGGEIWVDSGPGPGAVFSFTIPRHED